MEHHVETILNNTTKSPGKVFIVRDALENRSLIFICSSQCVYISDRKLVIGWRIAEPENAISKQEVEGDEREIEKEIGKRLNICKKRFKEIY